MDQVALCMWQPIKINQTPDLSTLVYHQIQVPKRDLSVTIKKFIAQVATNIEVWITKELLVKMLNFSQETKINLSLKYKCLRWDLNMKATNLTVWGMAKESSIIRMEVQIF